MNKLELDLIRQALTIEEFDEYQSVARRIADNSRAIPTKVAQGGDLGEMLTELSAGLAPRLETAKSAGATDRREKNAAELPWVHKASHKAVLQDIERLLWFNNRIIIFAAQMTAKHSLLGQLLAAQKLAALSVMQRDEAELGKVLLTFVRRLKNADLTTEAVKDLPNAMIAALAAALNGKDGNELADALGVPTRTRASKDVAEVDDELDALEKQIATAKDESWLSPTYLELAALLPDEPPVHLQPEDWDYDKGDLPREWWSAIFEADQYRFEDRLATPEEESAVLGMPLPEAHDWATLFDRDAGFGEIALKHIRNPRGAQNNVRDLFKSRTQCDPDCVDDNVVRVWIFLLAARQMNAEEHDRLFGRAYFDGVTMPLASPTPKMVRVLRWIGDD